MATRKTAGTRVPLRLALLALHREADRTGNQDYRVRAATLRQWKTRGHISAGPGYDLTEITSYLDGRGSRASAERSA